MSESNDKAKSTTLTKAPGIHPVVKADHCLTSTPPKLHAGKTRILQLCTSPNIISSNEACSEHLTQDFISFRYTFANLPHVSNELYLTSFYTPRVFTEPWYRRLFLETPRRITPDWGVLKKSLEDTYEVEKKREEERLKANNGFVCLEGYSDEYDGSALEKQRIRTFLPGAMGDAFMRRLEELCGLTGWEDQLVVVISGYGGPGGGDTGGLRGRWC